MRSHSLPSRIVRNLFEVPGLLLAWLFIAPIAWLIPKRRDWIAVIGGKGRAFGNPKYFFLQASQELKGKGRVVFIIDHADRHFSDSFNREGFEVMSFPGVKSVWFLVRCGIAVTDASKWYKRCRPQLLTRTKLIQLWHGVGFKRLDHKNFRSAQELNDAHGIEWFTREISIFLASVKAKIMRGRTLYDVFTCPSTFYEQEVFEPAFNSRYFLITGYPRNTFGRLPGLGGQLVWEGVDDTVCSRLKCWLREEKKLILFTPTFRDTRLTELDLSPKTLKNLDAFCESHNAKILFKFHPLDRTQVSISGQHLCNLRADSDLYPIMPMTHALVTDYSSIYMDYLLLDKPVHFFVPDLDDYMNKDRAIQFNYYEMTPGPKKRTWNELLAGIEEQWQNDTYGAERARLRKLAFDNLPQADAVTDVLKFATEKGWLQESPR